MLWTVPTSTYGFFVSQVGSVPGGGSQTESEMQLAGAAEELGFHGPDGNVLSTGRDSTSGFEGLVNQTEVWCKTTTYKGEVPLI